MTKVKELEKCLIAGGDYLNKVGIPFTLFGGALLGIMRDGGLLPHDKDVDVTVLAEDLTPDKVKAIEEAEFFKVHNKGKEEFGHFTFRIDNISFDIFVLYKKGDIRYINPIGNKCLVFPAECYEGPLGEITHLGRRWKIPYRHVDYFKAMYGNDWKVTKEKSNWHNAPCYKNWEDL